jgi:hypothetical protein
LSRSRNSWADGDRCVGLHLMQVSRQPPQGFNGCTVGSEPWRASLSDRVLIAENRCTAFCVSPFHRTLKPGSALQRRRASIDRAYMDRPLGPLAASGDRALARIVERSPPDCRKPLAPLSSLRPVSPDSETRIGAAVWAPRCRSCHRSPAGIRSRRRKGPDNAGQAHADPQGKLDLLLARLVLAGSRRKDCCDSGTQQLQVVPFICL